MDPILKHGYNLTPINRPAYNCQLMGSNPPEMSKFKSLQSVYTSTPTTVFNSKKRKWLEFSNFSENKNLHFLLHTLVLCSRLIFFSPQSPKLNRQDNVMKSRVRRFLSKYYLIQFLNTRHFLEYLKSKSTQMLQTPKRKLGSFV